ncbi:MAG: hypothetical protein NTZ59_11575, partial [Bacteroidetes bacterium]|nr:hypothetical protein [Bacteroidota bacterium]
DISLVEIPNLSATNTTICAGNSINLTATYSNTTATYSWSGPNGFTSNLQNPIIPNATTASSGTYICTVNTSNPNCSTTASITVTVTQPPIPTVSNVNYCVNSTPTPLTATGLTGATFNWLPSNIPNVSTVGTFNYTVSQTVNGCTSNTATLIVTVTPCNPCLANYATPVTTITGGTTQILTGNQTFSNANYFIANDITIDGNITFTDAEVLVADGVQITVAEGAVFNILGSHFYGCQQMWKGIKAATQTAIVNLDKSPTTYKSNLIEDAIIAIDMSSITGAVSYRNDHFALSASNTIFNKNNTSIKVSNYISSQPATYSVTRNPIWIQRNIFTSRNMPFSYGGFNWPNYSDIAALKDASNNNGFDIAPQTLASPYIIDAIYDPNISNAFLKTPYLNKKPECGIMLLNNGDALSSINSIAINLGRQLGAEEDVIAPTSNSLNLLFDNLCFGVKIKNSFVSIIGAVFQQPVLNAIGVQVNDNASKLVNIGYDSYMFGNFTGLNSYMVNGFYNLKYGIVSSNSYNVNISGNVFRGGNGNTDFGYKTIRAINLSCNNFKQLSVVGNECTNVSTGVYISNGSTDGSNIGNTGEINVSYNYLQAYHPNITPQGNENLRQAIYIGGTSLKSTTQQNLAKTINCLNNTLTGVVNGIQMLNIIGKRFVVKDNIITLANLQGASSSTTGFGISVGGCSPVWDRNNIENNIISGNDLDQSKQTGIFINNNARTNVQCNNVAGLTHGFRFYKTCLFTRFFDNVMDPSNLYGFTLENGGRITPQGKPTDTRNGIYGCTSNNNWYCGTSGWEFLYYPTPHFKTYCDNSIATSSPFLVGNVDPNSALSPDNGTNSPSAIYPQYGVAGSLEQVPNFSATTGDCMRCTFTNPVVLGGRTISNEDLQAQESIADGSIELVSSDEAMELYTLQQQLYEQLQEQDLSITNSTILNNFVQSHIWSSFDYIYY